MKKKSVPMGAEEKGREMVKELKRGAAVGTTFNRGLEIYKKNFVPLLLATLLAAVVGSISCGICTAPLFCGVFMMVLSAMRNNEAKLQAGDVFKGFQKFVPAFVSSLVLYLIFFVGYLILAATVIGLILLPVLCAVYGAVCFWSLLLVADQNATVGDAILAPLKLLGDKRFWSIVLVAFVASLLGCAGSIACGIGVFVTLPFAYCMVAAAYEEAYSDVAPATEAPAAPEAPAAEAPAADEPPVA